MSLIMFSDNKEEARSRVPAKTTHQIICLQCIQHNHNAFKACLSVLLDHLQSTKFKQASGIIWGNTANMDISPNNMYDY